MKVFVVLTSVDTPQPDGQTFGQTSVVLTDAAGAQQVAAAGAITGPDGAAARGAVFDVTAAGSGTVVAKDVDSNGVLMAGSSAMSGSFVIPPATVTFPMTTGLVVTLGA